MSIGSRAYILSPNSQLWGCESTYILGTYVNMCMSLLSVGMGPRHKIVSVVVEISLRVKEKTL